MRNWGVFNCLSWQSCSAGIVGDFLVSVIRVRTVPVHVQCRQLLAISVKCPISDISDIGYVDPLSWQLVLLTEITIIAKCICDNCQYS